MKTRKHKPDPHSPQKSPSPPQGFKKCTACAQVLPLHCFSVNRRMKDGYSARCSQCRNLVARYRRNPTRYHPVELPVAVCNEHILKSLMDKTKYTFNCRGGFILTMDFTRQAKKVNISIGGSTVLDIDFQQADTETCLYWVKQYLLDNEIWIVPE